MRMIIRYTLPIAILTAIVAHCLAQPVRGFGQNGATNTAKLTSQGKSIDEAFNRRFAAANKVASPIEVRARQEQSRGHYERALHLYEVAQETWRTNGIEYLDAYAPERIECYLALGNYQAVVTTWTTSKVRDEMATSACGIALTHLGRLQDARALYRKESVLEYMSGEDHTRDLPGTTGQAQLEASFRLARAVNRFYRAMNGCASQELESAARVMPHQPLISYYRLETSVRLGKWDVAATSVDDAKRLTGGLRWRTTALDTIVHSRLRAQTQ